MKRLTLLLTAAVLISIFVSSPLLASPPREEFRIASIHAFFTRCIARFFGPFRGYEELPPISGDDNDGRLGGDADDYANGRTGEPADGDEKTNGRLNAGPAVIGPEDYKPVYRIFYRD